MRWRTLIHEALHAHSAGYNGSDFRAFRGWEEGVVEHLQRLLRPKVLSRLHVVVPEDVFQRAEVAHPFAYFMDALEDLRRALKIADEAKEPFYRNLLATPIQGRPGFVTGRGLALPGRERADFLRAFSASNAVLKDEIR